MTGTNKLSERRLSRKTISTGIAYTYAGVIDVIGNRGMGAYIDNKSGAFGGTCVSNYGSDCDCCGDDGDPYYNCNTCTYYYVQFAAAPAISGSFDSNPSGGYYDASETRIKKGFKSFAVSSSDGSAVSDSTYYTCANDCATTTEEDMIDAANFGDSTFAGIKEADNTLWTWGINTYGQVGNNSVVKRKSPVQLGSNSWKMVSGGYFGFAAIRYDDTLWTWGTNASGQLGDNTTTSRSSPVQVDGYWKSVSCGYAVCSAIKSDDTLWTWGTNNNGELGINSTVTKSSPVQVSGGGSWQYIFAGEFNMHGIKTNGTMYGWGKNQYAAVGDNSTTDRSSPVQVGTSFSDWTNVRDHGSMAGTYAIRSNGTAYAWGYFPSGLVDGTYSSSLQIGSGSNHASWSIGWSVARPYIGNVSGTPFITTDGNVMSYDYKDVYSGPSVYNPAGQTSKYVGGGAKQLIVDALRQGYNYGNVFLMKYIE